MKRTIQIIILVLVGFGLLSLIAIPLVSPSNTSEFNETIISTWNHYAKRDMNGNNIPLSEEEMQVNHTYYSLHAVSDSTEIVYCKWQGNNILLQDTLTMHEFENSNGYSFVYMENTQGDTFTISSYYYDSLDIYPFNYTPSSEIVNMSRQTYSTDCPCKISVDIDDSYAILDQLLVVPNPASDFISIEYNTLENELFEGKIYDALGKEIKSFQVQNTLMPRIYVGNMSSGMYIVSIYKDDKPIAIQQLIIKH